VNVSDGSKILAGVISGDGDICCGSGFSGLFPAIERGARIKILAGAGISPVSILYTNKPDIKSVKDLVGRTVGTGAPGTALHQLVVADLKKYGVDYKKVTFANVGATNDVFKALVAGSIDAGPGPIEFRDTAANYKLSVIPDGQFYQELPLYNNQAMFASEKAIAEKRHGLVGVMAAHADLFRWMGRQENKDAFIKYYIQASGGKNVAEEAKFFQSFLSQPGRLATGLVIKEDAVRYTQELNIELGVQKALLSYDKVADMSLAEEALKLLKA
jgi:ABC-type nitrate/sulfonate/bicarbonate transport system substrate-binding protein